MNRDIVHKSIIGIFVTLYLLVATISMINSVAFFDLAHNGIMSWVLAVGFELGAAASLAAIIILDRTSKAMVWGLFILLTLFQMMANSFHAYINLEDYIGWIELFGLERMSTIEQKRILSLISGAVLPVVALGFIKSLVDYIRPDEGSDPSEEDPSGENLSEDLGIGQELIEHINDPADLNDLPSTQAALKEAARLSRQVPIDPDEPLALANSEYREKQQAPQEPPAKPEPKSEPNPAPKPDTKTVSKKMTPANSGGASVVLRQGLKGAPIAGSPSR
jgi:hypothetical protein